jgi:hypothetical protein
MKTIVIQIDVPDDAKVQVRQGNGGSRPVGQDSSDFVPRPDPEYPEGVCPVCGNDEWRMIKAGVSRKTGKRFNSFYVCNTEGCEGKPGRGDRGDLPF